VLRRPPTPLATYARSIASTALKIWPEILHIVCVSQDYARSERASCEVKNDLKTQIYERGHRYNFCLIDTH
jgi:hypothetical protein